MNNKLNQFATGTRARHLKKEIEGKRWREKGKTKMIGRTDRSRERRRVG